MTKLPPKVSNTLRKLSLDRRFDSHKLSFVIVLLMPTTKTLAPAYPV